MTDFQLKVREEARLIILKALAGQVDGRLNSSLIADELVTFGINRSREWVHAELRHLEEQGALTITVAGSVLVASLTARGLDHVARRIVLDGVKRPSPPEV